MRHQNSAGADRQIDCQPEEFRTLAIAEPDDQDQNNQRAIDCEEEQRINFPNPSFIDHRATQRTGSIGTVGEQVRTCVRDQPGLKALQRVTPDPNCNHETPAALGGKIEHARSCDLQSIRCETSGGSGQFAVDVQFVRFTGGTYREGEVGRICSRWQCDGAAQPEISGGLDWGRPWELHRWPCAVIEIGSRIARVITIGSAPCARDVEVKPRLRGERQSYEQKNKRAIQERLRTDWRAFASLFTVPII